jgi:hypothetical protein
MKIFDGAISLPKGFKGKPIASIDELRIRKDEALKEKEIYEQLLPIAKDVSIPPSTCFLKIRWAISLLKKTKHMDKREEMVLLMKEFENSGLSQKDFSASKGMGFHKFNYWYRKLKKEKANEGSSGFIRIDTLKADSGPAGQLELEYPNGVKIKLSSADLSLVSHLISVY